MENSKKIVVLDGYTLCAGELNFDALRAFGDVTVYDRAAQADVARLIGDAQIVLTNKAQITADVMAACPQMEYVGVTATGYNIVDVAEAKRRGIVVTNAPAYSTQAVAQHTFALLLESLNRVGAYSGQVRGGAWQSQRGLLLFQRADGGDCREDDRPDRLRPHRAERCENRAGVRHERAGLRAASQSRLGRRAFCDAGRIDERKRCRVAALPADGRKPPHDR